jgi:hypothetical protein
VQVEIEQSQRGLVGRQRAGNRVFIDGLVTEEDLDGFRSRLIDLPCTRSLISIAQVKPDKTDQLVVLSGACRLFQEWNRHDLLWHGSALLLRRLTFRQSIQYFDGGRPPAMFLDDFAEENRALPVD